MRLSMHAAGKVKNVIFANDQHSTAKMEYSASSPSSPHQEYVAGRTHLVFHEKVQEHQLSDKKSKKNPTFIPFETSGFTAYIHTLALATIPKQLCHTLYSLFAKIFFPLSNTISSWLSCTYGPSIAQYAKWVHHQTQHALISYIAKNMHEDNEKIEEQKRISNKKRAILLNEIQKEDLKKQEYQREFLRHQIGYT